jgi:hypothetical protein
VGIIEDVKKEVKEEIKERNNDKGVLDIITEKAISRKFLVWVVSSTLLFLGKIGPDEWVAITLGYVGIEGFADIAIKWRGAGK